MYLGNKDYILTVGFTRQSQRQLKIWDTRNLETEVKSLEIDQAAGVIMPFFDPDSNLLYLAGKVSIGHESDLSSVLMLTDMVWGCTFHAH